MSSSLQAWAFLSHLPVVELRMSVKGWWEGCEEQTERVLPANVTNIRDESSWLPLHADQEYVLQVSLRRLNAGQQRVSPPTDGEGQLFIVQPFNQYWFRSFQRKQDSKAQAPRFPKPKDEGWFLVLGEVEKKELLAIKRVGFLRNHSSVSVAFYTPEKTGK